MDTYDRVICFDLFHTLVVPADGVGTIYSDVLVELGVSRERIYSFVRASLMTSNLSVEEMVAALFDHFGIDPGVYADAFVRAVDGWTSDNDCRFVDGAEELLTELRARPRTAVCLVSNVTRPGWEEVDRRLALSPRFAGLHLSWCEGVAKPHPDCWTNLLHRLGSPDLPSHMCWMIGDNQADDLDPPAAMGWNTFLVRDSGANLYLVHEWLSSS